MQIGVTEKNQYNNLRIHIDRIDKYINFKTHKNHNNYTG